MRQFQSSFVISKTTLSWIKNPEAIVYSRDLYVNRILISLD
ncbi:hypothetical protein IGK30_003472 [Enterococcus sp. AZ178]